MESPVKYIKGFDGIRAISVFLVLFNHAGSYELLPDSEFWKERAWRLFSGDTGVQVFFTISGFLITLLLLNELERKGRIDFPRFFIRRFLRLMPALLLFLLVIVILKYSGVLMVSGYALLASMFYCYNFLPQVYNCVELTHTWSLGVEEQFYLSWPFVIRNFNWKSRVFLILLLVSVSAVLILFLPDFQYVEDEKMLVLGESYRPLRWILPAAAPILLGALFASKIHQNKGEDFPLFSSKLTPLVSIFLFLSPLFLPMEWIRLCVLAQGLAVALGLAWIYSNQNSTFARVLEFKPFAFVGRISYGLYVWQGLFLRTGPGSELWFQQFPQNILLTFLVALISYFLVERYFLKVKKRYS